MLMSLIKTRATIPKEYVIDTAIMITDRKIFGEIKPEIPVKTRILVLQMLQGKGTINKKIITVQKVTIMGTATTETLYN